MFNVFVIAFILTIMIGFIIENIKLNFDIRRAQYINMEIKKLLNDIIGGKSYFDIFIINDLRKIFNDKLLKTNIVDKYELYKVDDQKVKVMYTKGYIMKELELVTINGNIEIKEINMKLIE